MRSVSSFIRKHWALFGLVFVLAGGGVIAAPSVFNGSLNVITGGAITDNNAGANTVPVVNSLHVYTYMTPSPAATQGLSLVSGAGTFSPAYGLAPISSYSAIANNTAAVATPVPISAAAFASMLGTKCPPSVASYGSGSGTYTTPACGGVLPSYLEVKMCGGGGGGGGSSGAGGTAGNGGNGTATTFGTSLLSAGPGNGGAGSGNPAATNGGTASSGGTFIVNGGAGTPGNWTTTSTPAHGGTGGASFFGGGGISLDGLAGQAGVAYCSGGGGGYAPSQSTGGGWAGQGGGAGLFLYALITSPASSYSYSVGTGGAGGSAGTSGYAGGAGAGGFLIVTARWM